VRTFILDPSSAQYPQKPPRTSSLKALFSSGGNEYVYGMPPMDEASPETLPKPFLDQTILSL
jgi:hypothetical protein